jgi:hypothetical protein
MRALGIIEQLESPGDLGLRQAARFQLWAAPGNAAPALPCELQAKGAGRQQRAVECDLHQSIR